MGELFWNYTQTSLNNYTNFLTDGIVSISRVQMKVNQKTVHMDLLWLLFMIIK